MSDFFLDIKDSDFDDAERMDKWNKVHGYLEEILSELDENNKRIARLSAEIEQVRSSNNSLKEAIRSLSQHTNEEALREESLTLMDMGPDVAMDRPLDDEESHAQAIALQSESHDADTGEFTELDLANELKKINGIGDKTSHKIADSIFGLSNRDAVQRLVLALSEITQSGQMSMPVSPSEDEKARDSHE